MPCYLFTFHAYRSWMPDHRRGFTRRDEGVIPKDERMADHYHRAAKEPPIQFELAMQRAAIDECSIAAAHQGLRLHFVATDNTHVHVLVSWKDEKPWMKVRTGLKTSLTKRFNREFAHRTWLTEGGSRKQVKDEQHFEHLMRTYLPKHSGAKWSERDDNEAKDNK